MKKLLLPILLLIALSGGAYWWTKVVEVQRSPSSVQVDDARVRIWYNLVAPNYADTTGANGNLGLDYIGALIHTKTPAAIYFRDTTTGGHKWTILATTPASPIWGLITGTISSQTDLQTALNAKQNLIATGTTAQYYRGDLSLATFPTDLASFSNGPGYLTTVNVSMSIAGDGNGTPLKLVNDNASPGVLKYYGTNSGATKGFYDITALITNLYNTNGRFTGNRYVNAAGNSLLWDSVVNPTTALRDAGSNPSRYTLVDSGRDIWYQIGQSITGGGGFKQGMEIDIGGVRSGGLSGFSIPYYSQIMDSGRTFFIDQFGNYMLFAPSSFGQPGITFSPAGGKFSVYNLPLTNDSTYKPLAYDPIAGFFKELDHWPGATGATALVQTITSGSSGTVTGSNYWVLFNPASTISSYSSTLPASPIIGQSVIYYFGGTITSGTVITSFTVLPNTSQTILDNTPVSGVSVTTDVTIQYDYIATNTWKRKKL